MKFIANNRNLGELYEILGDEVGRIPQDLWDENILSAIDTGLPVKSITFIKTVAVDNDKLKIGSTKYELLDGEATLNTLFSLIDSNIFKESSDEYRQLLWNYNVGTTEIKETLTTNEKQLVKKLMQL